MNVGLKKNIYIQFLLQVCIIEQELNYLQKLNHENLVQYISMKSFQENGCLVIYILQVKVSYSYIHVFVRYVNIPHSA